jgi:hypothetical protein
VKVSLEGGDAGQACYTVHFNWLMAIATDQLQYLVVLAFGPGGITARQRQVSQADHGE